VSAVQIVPLFTSNWQPFTLTLTHFRFEHLFLKQPLRRLVAFISERSAKRKALSAMETPKKKNPMGKTLQTAREAGYFQKMAIKNALSALEEGRPIGWSMVTWYHGELICKAMGMELLFPENYGAFCAATGKAKHYLNVAEAEGFPASTCGYARNCIGYAKEMADNDGATAFRCTGRRPCQTHRPHRLQCRLRYAV
jgi:hypothetical protein